MLETTNTPPAPKTDPAETPARPKVMRRPAHFSQGPAPAAAARSTVAEPTAQITAAPAPTPAAPISHSWQEDGRFGLALIVLVVAINIALMFGVPLIAHTPNAAEPSSVTVVSTTSMPQAVITRHAPVTLYSDPDLLDNNERRMDLNLEPSAANDDFSATARAIPAPAARSFGEQ